jgi:hypothetical protein
LKIRLLSFSNINTHIVVVEDMLPSTMDRKAYVYSNYVNTIENRTFSYYRLKVMRHNFPKKFLNQNKNLIYNNGSSEIFK